MALSPITQLVLSFCMVYPIWECACSSVQVEIKMVQLQCQVMFICCIHLSTTRLFPTSFLFLISVSSTFFLTSSSLLLFSLHFSLLFLLPSILPPSMNRCAIHLSVQVHRTGLYQYRTTLGVLPIDWIS